MCFPQRLRVTLKDNVTYHNCKISLQTENTSCFIASETINHVRARVEHCVRERLSYRREPQGCNSGGKRSTKEYLRVTLNDAVSF
jgi:hypothetical protein